MELLYTWIEEYKNIKEQGLNFSSKYQFEFIPERSPEGSIIKGLLNCKENPNHIENFFGESITNITAIIGENGAGKSNIIEALSLFQSENFFSMNLISILYDVHTGEKIAVIRKENALDFFYKKIQKKTTIIDLINDYESDITLERDEVLVSTVFYSNIFEYINIYSRGFSLLDTYTLYQGEGSLRFESNEILRQINFIISNALPANLIKVPEKLRLVFSLAYEASLGKKYFSITYETPSFIQDQELNRNIEYYIERINTKNKNTTSKTSDYFVTEIFYNFLNLLEWSNPMYLTALKESIENKESMDLKDINDNIKESIERFIDKLPEDHNISKLKNSLSLLQIIEEKYDQNAPSIDLDSFTEIIYFIDLYQKTIISKPYIYFVWQKLSSGQKAFLNLFSRFFSIKEDIQKETLLFIIDEGELGFHPEWQRKYLYILTEVLPKIFPKKRIQLILTSHSPFLVSDLPKESIIFLSKDENGECKVSQLHEHKDTFGANIHTLFTDSFFMKEGLTGKFSEQRINELIAYFNDEPFESGLFKDKTSEEKKQIAQKLIRAIGEPIVKNLLQKQLDSKNLEKVNNHEERIKKLEEELTILKKQKDDTN